ncbi:MAG: RNHCP domain-containing protein [Patescibacteria group bacterium]
MSTKRFQRRIEDFVCAHCGEKIAGDGYTNHCPYCLWSKHVDIHPGDRAAACGGMMRPTALEGTSPDYRIIHTCERCGFVRPNSVDKDDDVQAVLAIAGIH